MTADPSSFPLLVRSQKFLSKLYHPKSCPRIQYTIKRFNPLENLNRKGDFNYGMLQQRLQ